MSVESERSKAAQGLEEISRRVLEAQRSRRQVAPFSRGETPLSMTDAYAVARLAKDARIAAGERIVGRKIGFTNSGIWDEYDVHAPIWGYMYDGTVHDLDGAGDGFSLTQFCEPRIEPEIAFGFRAAPRPEMDEAALLETIDWVAHGFEIVDSIYPGWVFDAADTAAAFALHGAYICGPRHPVPGAGAIGALRDFKITLRRDGEVIDRGTGANVLGSPLLALRHVMDVIAGDPGADGISAGEIVTTGTLTRAFPVAPGERWETEIDGLPLEGLAVTFA